MQPVKPPLLALFLALVLLPLPVSRGDSSPDEGIVDRRPGRHALVGARVHVQPGHVVEDATILLEDGVIRSVGATAVPAGYRVHDLAGCDVTAGFIELDHRVALPEKESDGRVGRSWNKHVQPERSVLEVLPLDEKAVRELGMQGFTVSLCAPEQGIFAGRAVLVSHQPGKGEKQRDAVMQDDVALVTSLQHGAWRERTYPGSLMGAYALMRQTLHDAGWYRAAWRRHTASPGQEPRPAHDEALETIGQSLDGKLPVAVRTKNPFQMLTVDALLGEFGIDPWFLGSGDEYEWADSFERQRTRTIVVPLEFPKRPAVDRPHAGSQVTLRRLERWAHAVENPARLRQAGFRVGFTTRGLEAKKTFAERVRKAMEHGTSFDDALAAVTTVPARCIGMEGKLGTIASGKLAHLAVFDGEPFAKDTTVRELWVDGERVEMSGKPPPDLRGQWSLSVSFEGGDAACTVKVGGSARKPKPSVVDHDDAKAMLHVDGTSVALTVAGAALGREGFVGLSGTLDDAGTTIRGVVDAGGEARVPFTATRTAGPDEEPEDAPPAAAPLEALPRPLGARGRTAPPFRPGSVLVRGATVWTCGPDGILEDTDVLVQGGKIADIGSDLAAPPGAHVIEGGGLHVTPGIIDAHSHTAIHGGVNEGTQAVTAEVRINDVIDANDVNLYRQLAGGITMAQLLHGSANPIGGQAATIKLRWGEAPERLKLRGAPTNIKFALGENVKQSNWGDDFTTRYPQTRMGVEQIMRDRFNAARKYQQDRAAGKPVRRDLELDALVEILDGSRHIHCHSYRQDEILMLMRLAESFDFRVGTFQHVLEGYKVAPELAEHGAMASAFSDWWAFKFEVYEAIPYNGALMHRAGVVTSFNSDSAELARRMNLEAAKAVKYGGVPRSDAFQFITLNPARQLRIDDRVGSLEKGKDADFVVWNRDPLSSYALCMETWIDGARMYSRAEEAALAERDRARKQALVARVLTEQLSGKRENGEGDDEEEPKHDHGCLCDHDDEGGER